MKNETIEFLEDIICTSSLLPSEHRASSQLLRMLTKEEPTQTPKINLGTLLTSLQVSEKNECKFDFCFVQPIFHFWFLVTLGKEVTKIRKYYVIFIYILQGKMGKTEKRKENHATKVTKISKTKRQKYGMKKTFDCLAFGDYSNC